MTQEYRGPELVRDDDLTRELRSIYAAPSDAAWWTGFEERINARIDAVTMYTLMNQAKYDSMPPDLKKLIDDGGPHFTQLWSTLWKKTDEVAIETAKKNGNKVLDMPDDNRNAWREKLKPVVDKYIDEQAKTLPNAREIYDSMVVTLKKYE